MFLFIFIKFARYLRLVQRTKFNSKYKYGNRHFWCRGYFVDTVGKNEKAIKNYIRNQLEDDVAKDQITMKEYMDPFAPKGNK